MPRHRAKKPRFLNTSAMDLPHESDARPEPCVRCQYQHATTHRRCSMTTCARFPFCHVHLKMVLGLAVKPSTLPNAGMGLFFVGYKDARTGEHVDSLPRGEVIAWYSGYGGTQQFLRTADFNARYAGAPAARTAYNIRLGVPGSGGGDHLNISAYSALSWPGRYANDGRGVGGYVNNVAFANFSVDVGMEDGEVVVAAHTKSDANKAAVGRGLHQFVPSLYWPETRGMMHLLPIVTTRHVGEGDELLVSYGPHYWAASAASAAN